MAENNVCAGMCCGLFLVPCCIAFIFWNENNAVISYATAHFVLNALEAKGCIPDRENSAQLIFAACTTYAPDLAQQLPQVLQPFLPSFEGSEISWSPEIYQNIESSETKCRKDSNGHETCVTTYTCSKSWSTKNIDSSAFQCPSRPSNDGHTLPANLNGPGSKIADERTVILSSPQGREGGFALDLNLQRQFPSRDLGSQLGYGPGQTIQWQRNGGTLLTEHLSLSGGYLSTCRGNPIVGDVRVSLSGKAAAQATVAAMQQPGYPYYDLGPYPSQTFGWFGKRTKPLERLVPWILSKDDFVTSWNAEIETQTWLIRILAIFLMVIAFEMIFQPLSKATDLLRFFDYFSCSLGSVLAGAAQCVIHTLAATMALFLAFVAIAIAWLIARPGLTLGLLFIAAGLFALLVWHAKGKFAIRQARSPNYASTGLVEASQLMGGQSRQATPCQVEVVCPIGVGPGGLVQVQAPNRQLFHVAVPQGISSGQVFVAQLPV